MLISFWKHFLLNEYLSMDLFVRLWGKVATGAFGLTQKSVVLGVTAKAVIHVPHSRNDGFKILLFYATFQVPFRRV